MTTKTYSSFSEEVWDKLSRLNIADHTDQLPKTAKRPAVTYLSWSNAWLLLKRNFPASTYSHRTDLRHPDGTVEVEVDVIISKDGAQTQFTNARLSVMDNYFNPIQNPTARQINDSRQRALVKALAFAGLGLDLWADTVVPVGRMEDYIDFDQLEILTDLIKKSKTDEEKFLKWCDLDAIEKMPVERYGSAVALLESKVRRLAAEKKVAK